MGGEEALMVGASGSEQGEWLHSHFLILTKEIVKNE